MTTAHDSIGRFHENMRLLEARRSRTARVRQQYIGSFGNRGLDFRSCPPETLKAVREEVRAELEKQNRRQITVAIMILFAAAIVIAVFWAMGFGKI